MKVLPLESLTIEEAMALQFRLVDCVTQEFPGNDILTRGDLGVVPGYNQPVFTRRIEKVIAQFFNVEDALLVRGSGTNAIRLALFEAVGSGKKILIHDAPIYPTTQTTFDMLNLTPIRVDFNDLTAVKQILQDNTNIAGALVQVTRQKLNDTYRLEEVITTIISEMPHLPIVTDDNYAALKTKKLGAQLGACASCFSTFKLLGPEGVGCIIGTSTVINNIRLQNYSGGGQVQGHEALDVLKGMIYAPVSLAISATVGEKICEKLNSGVISQIKEAFIVNAQSKVVIVRLNEPIAKQVIAKATQLGALPNPVGAESKYEFSPLVYRVSSTFRQMDPQAEDYFIRINPNRAGVDTIMRILTQAIEQVFNNG